MSSLEPEIADNTRAFGLVLLVFFICFFSVLPIQGAEPGPGSPYTPLPGLIDVRSTFSDGKHNLEALTKTARQRGFKVLFMTDHDRVELSYGMLPFRNLLRIKKERPSIMTYRPMTYLMEIERVAKKYPDMIIIPGCETSPFYYWTGSWFKKDMTAHDYDRKMLLLNLNRAEDYEHLPIIGGRNSLRYTKGLLPGLVFYVIPFLIGFFFLKRRGFFRYAGLFLMILSLLGMIDYNPFRSSPFTPYRGDQGLAPYQEVIDYVNRRGAFAFWNYPEQKSGRRKLGPIFLDTLPYPEVIYRSKNYTGFAAIYGDTTTATDPGKAWDRALLQYCRGEREKPPWGISAADFHEEGRLGLRLGAFPTTFFVKEPTVTGVLDALKTGRMVSSRGDGTDWATLNYFQLIGEGGHRAFMGERLTTSQPPLISFKLSYHSGKRAPLTVYLIRGGKQIKTFTGETPFERVFEDKEAPAGELTYYRLMSPDKHLISNPVFMKITPPSPGN